MYHCVLTVNVDTYEASSLSNTNLVSKQLSIKAGLLSALQSPDQEKGSNSVTKVSSCLAEPTLLVFDFIPTQYWKDNELTRKSSCVPPKLSTFLK